VGDFLGLFWIIFEQKMAKSSPKICTIQKILLPLHHILVGD
jgi:hypothetical protein